MTELQSIIDGFLKTLNDHGDGKFFRDLPFVDAVQKNIKRVVNETRENEAEKLKANFLAAKVMDTLYRIRDKYDREKNLATDPAEREKYLAKFDAAATCIDQVHAVLGPKLEAELGTEITEPSQG